MTAWLTLPCCQMAFSVSMLGPACHKPLTIIPTFLLHQTPYPSPPPSLKDSGSPASSRKQRTVRKHQFLLSSCALACVLSQPDSSCNWTPLLLLLSHCLSVNIYLFFISYFPSTPTFTSHPVTQLSLLYFQRPSLNYTFFPINLYVYFLLQALLVNPWSLLFHHGLSLFSAQPTPFILEFVLFIKWSLEAALWAAKTPEYGFLLLRTIWHWYIWLATIRHLVYDRHFSRQRRYIREKKVDDIYFSSYFFSRGGRS